MVQVKGQALPDRMEFGTIDEEPLPPAGTDAEYLVLAGPDASRQIGRDVKEHGIGSQTEFRFPFLAPFRGKMRLDPVEIIVDENRGPFKIQFLPHVPQRVIFVYIVLFACRNLMHRHHTFVIFELHVYHYS